jgi:hypothetical protein
VWPALVSWQESLTQWAQSLHQQVGSCISSAGLHTCHPAWQTCTWPLPNRCFYADVSRHLLCNPLPPSPPILHWTLSKGGMVLVLPVNTTNKYQGTTRPHTPWLQQTTPHLWNRCSHLARFLLFLLPHLCFCWPSGYFHVTRPAGSCRPHQLLCYDLLLCGKGGGPVSEWLMWVWSGPRTFI